jgi:hypothetical protein
MSCKGVGGKTSLDLSPLPARQKKEKETIDERAQNSNSRLRREQRGLLLIMKHSHYQKHEKENQN